MSYQPKSIRRLYEIKPSDLPDHLKKLYQIRNENPYIQISILYEFMRPIFVIDFDTQEDCSVFILKYGTNYV
jgi:hypothetical protein